MDRMLFTPWFSEVGEVGEGEEEEKEDGGRGVGRPFWVCIENERWWWLLPVWVGFWSFREPLETDGIKEEEWELRPVEGLRRLEGGTEALAGGLRGLVLSPLDTELLFPEVEEKAGIFEAGRVGEVDL